MYQSKIEYLKREIKKAYKRYTGERTDEKATILDVAKFFNIPIDESRMEDYAIKKIDYTIPSIEIIDEKNAITYNAMYTDKAKQFITKMTFTDGEYDLTFERQMKYPIDIFNAIIMTVKYLQNVVYDGQNEKELLLNKNYTQYYKDEKLDRIFERSYIYDPYRLFSKKRKKQNDMYDKYAHIKNNSVIYGIEKLEREGFCNFLAGVCFECLTSIKPSGYFPFSMYYKINSYPLLNNRNVNSAMLFELETWDAIHYKYIRVNMLLV